MRSWRHTAGGWTSGPGPAAPTIGEGAYVFTRSVDGTEPWVPNEVTKVFIALRNKVGLKNVRLHDLRHFAATRCCWPPVSRPDRRGRLGHANAATTLGVLPTSSKSRIGKLPMHSVTFSTSRWTGQTLRQKAGSPPPRWGQRNGALPAAVAEFVDDQVATYRLEAVQALAGWELCLAVAVATTPGAWRLAADGAREVHRCRYPVAA